MPPPRCNFLQRAIVALLPPLLLYGSDEHGRGFCLPRAAIFHQGNKPGRGSRAERLDMRDNSLGDARGGRCAAAGFPPFSRFFVPALAPSFAPLTEKLMPQLPRRNVHNLLLSFDSNFRRGLPFPGKMSRARTKFPGPLTCRRRRIR